MRRQRIKYDVPEVTAAELGLDDTPCASCNHPAWQHYSGSLMLKPVSGGHCHAKKCTCEGFVNEAEQEKNEHASTE
jgi:hypothetical protein